MSAATVRSPAAASGPPSGADDGIADPAWNVLFQRPGSATMIRLVAPGAIPNGGILLGHLVAVPAAEPLVAEDTQGQTVDGRAVVQRLPHQPVGDPWGSGGPTQAELADGLLECRPGLVIDRLGRRVLVHGREVMLTRREFDLLEHLARHDGRVFTRAQLLAAVWEMDDPRYTPPRTVDVHVSRLRHKLSEHAIAVQSVRGVGYRWSARAEPGRNRS
ncbi:MAG TPA: winged helix-turn-helix domain-containing protein [Kineosporiaceae bacterium]